MPPPARVPTGTIEAAPAPRGAEIDRVRATARALAKAKLWLAKAEAVAKIAADDVRKLEERDLPNALLSAGVPSFDLGEGWRVETERFAHGSVKEADADFAWDWMEADGSGDLVKATITISFGKGEHKAELRFLRDLAKRKKPLDFIVARAVHAATLKKFIRERIAAENAGEIPPDRRLPRDLFGIHEGTRAVLIGPETEKKK